MSAETETANPAQSFVIMPLAARRIALEAQCVIELVAPGKLQSFPHGTSWISGVLVRRNRVVPVCDAGILFGERTSAASRFYLIAEWKGESARDWCAIPVHGECELASAILERAGVDEASAGAEAEFVAGKIAVEDEKIEVIDLAKLIEARRFSGDAGPVETA